jgi:hypothetical protein
LKRVLRVLAEADNGDVRTFPRRYPSHVLDLNLARDHLVPQGGDSPRNSRQAIRALVCDQHA